MCASAGGVRTPAIRKSRPIPTRAPAITQTLSVTSPTRVRCSSSPARYQSPVEPNVIAVCTTIHAGDHEDLEVVEVLDARSGAPIGGDLGMHEW